VFQGWQMNGVTTKKGLAAGAVALVAALLVAPQAMASTATVTGADTVKVTETGDETNNVRVTYASATDLYTITDTANLTPAGTCSMVDTHTVTCPGVGIKTISVDTDARDDSIALDPATIPTTVKGDLKGGGGFDNLSGSNGPCTIDGESGNDLILGGKGADSVKGSGGRDTVNGGDGADDIAGGNSVDTLVYPSERITPIIVTIGSVNGNDGGAEDQTGSRRDTVRGDIETVIGTPAADQIGGDRSTETLNGMAGDDVLVGNGGNDSLNGFEGNDQMFGLDGSDTLRGSLGNDLMFGGNGNDRLAGGPDGDFLKGGFGSDVMKGKTGIDGIRAKDGTRDVKISCGPGPNGAEGARRDRRLDPRAKSC
jgi:Ca2+-binding RTX toxin-like protein